MKKTYLVGGAVRDLLMGIEPKDRDYVVVGSSPKEMLDLGFTQVGSAFPVFLHPETNEEYALARIERKTGAGYNGFSVDFDSSVTLEEDLSRRDLTMNSIAMDLETGEFIDPFNGCEDIKNRVIRHTSKAFSEDPLRVLRVARFVARYNFTVDHETTDLCRKVLRSDDARSLTSERIWVEFDKMCSEKHVQKALRFLRSVDASSLYKLHPFIFTQDYPNLSVDYTKIEKLYLFTQIHTMTKSEANDFKIPTAVHRCVMMYADARMLLTLGTTSFDFMLYFLKTYATHIEDGWFYEFEEFLKQLDTDCNRTHTSRSKFFEGIQRAYFDIKELDFTDMVKGMNGSEIKEFVYQKKLEIVKKHVQ